MKHVNNTKLLTCFLLTSLLGGCAYNTSTPYQSFERIEIIAHDSETSIESFPSRGESAATGAAAGAFGGLTASFLASLVCGPYFPACFAAAAPVTIGATTLLGGAMGVSGISDEDAAKIISHLETLQANRNVSQEIAAALAEVLPVSSLAPPGVADARISLDKKSLRVVKGFGRSIVFSLAVDTRYEWSLNKPSPQQSLRTFSCDKRLRPINEWVSDEAATIEHELNYCVKDIARQINKVLTEQPPASDNRFPELDV